MARHFHISPVEVDRMELWQVISCLLPEQDDDAAQPSGTGPGKVMRPIDVIKARYAAAERGEFLTGDALFGTPVPAG